MLTGYRLTRPAEPARNAFADLPREPSYRDLLNLLTPLLGTGDFEHVAVLRGDDAADMFVDENGGLKHLPRNEEATALYRASWMQKYPHTDPETLSAIYGPAVVFDRQVWF